MSDHDGRFEFRTFGQSLENAASRMARLSDPLPEDAWEKYSEEWYILSKSNEEYNMKIRNGQIDVKKLVRKVNGLEQWKPVLKQMFPVSSFYAGQLFELSGADIPDLEQRDYAFDELFRMLLEHDQLQLVEVKKHRFAYKVNNCICETATVLFNGAMLNTVSVESDNAAQVLSVVKNLHLISNENISYVEAVKRVIGMKNEKFIS